MHQIGIDIGGTKIKIGLVADGFKLLKTTNINFPTNKNSEKTVNLIVNHIRRLIDSIGISLEQIVSIGIATAGSVDEEKGLIVNAHNLGFHNVPIVKMMQGHFKGKNIALINDADAATYAELKAGSLYGINIGVMITIGTGIGSGIVLGGEIFRGGQGQGTEFGHMTLQQEGPVCSCGNRGCVETLCSASWLVEQGMISMSKRLDSLIFKRTGGDVKRVTGEIVIDSAKEGDACGKIIFRQYLDNLSSAVTSIANFLDPEVIVIGGGVSLVGDFLFNPLRELVEQKSFFKTPCDIIPAKFGNHAGIIGATCWASRT